MNHPMKRLVACTVLLACLSGASAQDDAESIAAVIRTTPELSMLAGLLEDTGLMASLETDTRVTFFAPSDAAFEHLGEDAVAALLRDRGSLDLVIRHHLVYGATAPDALRRLDALTTLEGTRLNVQDLGDRVRVGGVRMPSEAVEAGNGLVYVIDRILLPDASRLIKDLLANPAAR